MSDTRSLNATFELDESESRYRTDKHPGGLTPKSQDAQNLWTKGMLRYQAFSRFWRPRIVLGRKCARYNNRKIFTEAQKEYYEKELHKIVVEPQEMKPVIDTLMGVIKSRVQAGIMTMEDDSPPQGAAAPESVNIVLKWMENEIGMQSIKDRALRDGLVVGFPQCVWFDRVGVMDGLSHELRATLLRWEAALPSPRFEDHLGRDIEELIQIRKYTKAEMYEIFPERVSAFKEAEYDEKENPGYFSTLMRHEQDGNADSRASWIYDMVINSSWNSHAGYFTVIQDTFPVKHEQRIYYDPDAKRAVVIPRNWNEDRKKRYLNSHPEFSTSMRRKIKTLWNRVISTDGFVWYNGPHWYQWREAEGSDRERVCLPCSWFIPDYVDYNPAGKGEDMLPYVFNMAIAETEGLDEVRKGSGTLMVYAEGGVRRPSRVKHELSQPVGVIVAKRHVDPSKAVMVERRTPTDVFFQYGDRMRDQLQDVHNVQPAQMGEAGGRQSAKAKDMEIQQGIMPQTPYVVSYSYFDLSVANRIVSFLPMVMNQHQIIQIKDEFGESQSVEVNQMDFLNGQAEIIANDLTSARYRMVAIPGDTSKTSREQQMRQFFEMLEAIGNTVLQMQPVFMAQTLASFPNIYMKQAGRYMLQAAQAQAQSEGQQADREAQLELMNLAIRREIEAMKVLTPKVMLKTDAADIQQYPEGFRVFITWLQQAQANAQQTIQEGKIQQQATQEPPQEQMPPQEGGPAPGGPEGAPQPEATPVGA